MRRGDLLFLGVDVSQPLARARVEPGVAWVLAITLPLVVIWANTVATLVPLIAERANIDPAVVSAPMITTIVDATGLFIYLTLASIILLG